jgi:hypothetical protein
VRGTEPAELYDECSRALHVAADTIEALRSENERLRSLAGSGEPVAWDREPLGLGFQMEIAAKVLLGELPAEGIDTEGLGHYLRGQAGFFVSPSPQRCPRRSRLSHRRGDR